ncbi:MAG: hypothetical protein PHR25_03685 [Clostridia bacterium]|nr:hypothetical protein [Clostridia bacterium]MDD4375863.1 hypothetical protein [Clostridia bacterium]
MKKILMIIMLIFFCFIFREACLGADVIIEETSKELKIGSLLEELKEFTKKSELAEELELSSISQTLMMGKSNDYSNIIKKAVNIFTKEIVITIKATIAILIVVVIMGIINSLEIDKESSAFKISNLICLITIITMLVNTYMDVIKSYSGTINILSSIMQTVSPFLMVVLVATGGITSSTLIQPAILFIASLIGFLINYVVIPFTTISIVMSMVSSLGTTVRLNKLGELFSKSSIWITGVVFTLFLSLISVKGTITTSIDSTVVKTTQTAISNLVPVVGKFVSDSLESIMGATQVIGKTGGVIGIIVMIIVSIVPILKMIIIFTSHKILSALTETITDNKEVVNCIDKFAEGYKVLLGVLVRGLSTIYNVNRSYY